MSYLDKACEHMYGHPFCPMCGVKLHTKSRPKFPIKTIVYLHSNKERMIEIGAELGLDDDAIMEKFRGCCYEVKITIEVNEDGTYKILNCEE